MHRSRLSTDALTPRDPGAIADDRGSAALEFILVGLLLLVPIVYLIVALGVIQGQSLGVETGARQVARAVADAPDAVTATARAEEALQAVAEQYGLEPDSVEFSLECRPAGVSCPTAGATIVVTIASRVALPFVPPILGLDRLATVPVRATAVQKVSRFWSAG